MTSPGTDAPRWLDDQEAAAWTAFVQMMMRLPGALDRQLRRDSQLTHVQYAVLALLSAAGSDGVTMSDLAVATSVESSRLSHSVRALDEGGLVTRSPGPIDKRVQVARITEAGAAVLRLAAPGHVELVRELVIDRLTPSDLKDLRRISSKVVCALDAATPSLDPAIRR